MQKMIKSLVGFMILPFPIWRIIMGKRYIKGVWFLYRYDETPLKIVMTIFVQFYTWNSKGAT